MVGSQAQFSTACKLVWSILPPSLSLSLSLNQLPPLFSGTIANNADMMGFLPPYAQGTQKGHCVTVYCFFFVICIHFLMLFSINVPSAITISGCLHWIDLILSSFFPRRSQVKRVKVETIFSGNHMVHQWLLIPKEKWQNHCKALTDIRPPKRLVKACHCQRNQFTFQQREM